MQAKNNCLTRALCFVREKNFKSSGSLVFALRDVDWVPVFANSFCCLYYDVYKAENTTVHITRGDKQYNIVLTTDANHMWYEVLSV
jgi:hypothetical protein